jgi:OmpA-OmpF porin, OOP family
MFIIRSLLIALLIVAASGLFESADAQILNRIRDRAKQEVERRVENQASRAVNRTLDSIENAVVCVVTDPECIAQAEADGHAVVVVDQDGNQIETREAPATAPAAQTSAAAPSAGGAAALRPGEGVWANYDFVPGERVLFTEDFARDRVGNFPRRLEFLEGNMEIVEWQGQRLLRVTAMSALAIPLPETLPARFTIEYDMYSDRGDWVSLMTASTLSRPLNYGEFKGTYFLMEQGRAGVDGETGPKAKTDTDAVTKGLAPVRIMVDGNYAKMFVGEHRVANVPNATIIRGDKLHMIFWYARSDQPTYIGNIRVMAGGAELYDALVADGRFATQGILFDTGSDVIRPESTPTLRDIGDMLRQHSDLRLRIEGHTDATGNADANKSLSERRAAAVKAFLVSTYGVDASRIESQGLGQTKPVASNDSPEGRQQNRRVELVRL